VEIYVTVSLLTIFSIFMRFNRDYIIYIDVTSVAASNPAVSE